MTKSIINRNHIVLSAIFLALLLLSACATTMQQQDSIEERAVARWDALLSGDIEGAYEYLSPGYRSSVSLLQYHRTLLMTKVKWTGAKYIESSCEETVCNVKILLDFTVYGALPGVKSMDSKQSITESWVLVNRSWHLVPKN